MIKGSRKLNKNVATKDYVKKQIKKDSELKHFNKTADTTASTTASIVQLSDAAAGNGDNQRVGSSLAPHSLEITLQMLEADLTNVFRVILFQWKGDNASNPPIVGQLLTTPADPLSHRSWHRRKQLRVISDKIYQSSSTGDSNQIIVRKRFKLSNYQQVRYTGTATDGYNQFYILFMSDSGAATHPTFNYRSRFYYYDD